MSRTLAAVLLVHVAAASAAPSPTTRPARYVSSNEIILEYRAAQDRPVTTAELYVSTDGGRTWRPVDADQAEAHRLRFTATRDGRYAFYLVLQNEAGTSAEPPVPGTPPTAEIVVDTAPPLVQLHRARILNDANEPPALLLETSLVEENLSESGLRVFYRAAGRRWRDGGAPTSAASGLLWPVPADVNGPIDLRIVATDLAGNRAIADLPGVSTPPPKAPATQSIVHEQRPQSDSIRAAAVLAADAELAPLGSAARPAGPPRRDPEPQRLRELANRFAADGSYDLAAARLEEAVRLAPRDADLLAELGAVQYRLGQNENAASQFSAAAALQPDHLAALEGAALVAATQKRYPEAREYLQHLLRVLPESGAAWLRYGDVEHRLGNAAAAVDAWERVLTLSGCEADTRSKAERRLKYFRPDSARQ